MFSNTIGATQVGMNSNTIGHSMMMQEDSRTRGSLVFRGNIEVHKVENGYTVAIAAQEGYVPKTYVASTAKEVNEIITTAVVAFRLEGT
jgi:hypothetical protein